MRFSGCKRLVSEELGEGAAEADQVLRAGPFSTMRPSRSTTARSATRIVESRWPAISTVRPATAGPQGRDEVALGLGVDGRHRVVEDDHARLCDQRARERDALALTAREVDAALADQRVVAVAAARRRTRPPRPSRRRRAPRPSRRRGARRAGCRAAASRTARASASRARPTARSSASASVAAVDPADQHRARRWGRRSAAAG